MSNIRPGSIMLGRPSRSAADPAWRLQDSSFWSQWARRKSWGMASLSSTWVRTSLNIGISTLAQILHTETDARSWNPKKGGKVDHHFPVGIEVFAHAENSHIAMYHRYDYSRTDVSPCPSMPHAWANEQNPGGLCVWVGGLAGQTTWCIRGAPILVATFAEPFSG